VDCAILVGNIAIYRHCSVSATRDTLTGCLSGIAYVMHRRIISCHDSEHGWRKHENKRKDLGLSRPF